MSIRLKQLLPAFLIFVGLLVFNSCRREPPVPVSVFLGAGYGMTMEKVRASLHGGKE